jgi:hypothetical protein
MTAPAPAPVLRQFTLDEANRTLPLVRMIVQDIVELFQDLQRRRERLTELRGRRGGRKLDAKNLYESELLQMESEVDADLARLQGYQEELQKIGVELQDPVSGQVDFRAQVGGREVLFCWRPGEATIEFWREPKSAFRSRHSLAELAQPATTGDAVSDRRIQN